MIVLYSVLGALIFLATAAVITAFICYRRVFYSPKRTEPAPDEYPTPPGKSYDPYRSEMIKWIKKMRELPAEEMRIFSHDGLALHGRYFEHDPDAPVEILFHGYRGTAERDLSGGIVRAFALGRNALLVDHRASGKSEGHTVSFGILEKRDCLLWIDHAIRRFGADKPIHITGISMGAATVLLAAGEELPPNVASVLADCPYSSAREIIEKVMRDMGLPAKLLYPFVRLGARLFGGFDPDEDSPIESVARARVPIIFFHGEEDGFVPCEMSRRLYAACASPKKRLITVEGADHGLAFSVARENYVKALAEFEAE